MMLGLGLGLPALAAWQTLKGWSPAALWPPGTPGFCGGLSVTEAYQKGYLFQDAGGTTAAALEQPVGLALGQVGGINASQPTSTKRPTLSARVNLLAATAALSTQSVTTLAANHILSFSGAGTVTLSGTATGVKSAGSNAITCTAGTLTLTVSGSVTNADLRPADTPASLPAYQRVNTASDYDTVGFPYYLKFDGVDDCLVTPSINLTGTDKATVFAGARLVGAANGSITCLGNIVGGDKEYDIGVSWSSPGDVMIQQGSSAGTVYQYGGASTPPISEVLAISTDWSNASIPSSVRRNGATLSLSKIGSFSTTSFRNAPAYIGMRGGTTLPFNGHMYTLPIIVGRAVEPALIAEVEAAINASMGGIY